MKTIKTITTISVLLSGMAASAQSVPVTPEFVEYLKNNKIYADTLKDESLNLSAQFHKKDNSYSSRFALNHNGEVVNVFPLTVEKKIYANECTLIETQNLIRDKNLNSILNMNYRLKNFLKIRPSSQAVVNLPKKFIQFPDGYYSNYCAAYAKINDSFKSIAFYDAKEKHISCEGESEIKFQLSGAVSRFNKFYLDSYFFSKEYADANGIVSNNEFLASGYPTGAMLITSIDLNSNNNYLIKDKWRLEQENAYRSKNGWPTLSFEEFLQYNYSNSTGPITDAYQNPADWVLTGAYSCKSLSKEETQKLIGAETAESIRNKTRK